MCFTPDFAGQDVSKVKAWTDAHQVTLSTKEESDVSKSEGAVLTQAPVAAPGPYGRHIDGRETADPLRRNKDSESIMKSLRIQRPRHPYLRHG